LEYKYKKHFHGSLLSKNIVKGKGMPFDMGVNEYISRL